jgi:hypothetical protein
MTTIDAFTLNAAIFVKLGLERCTAWSALLTWGLRLSPRHAPDQAPMRRIAGIIPSESIVG